MTAYTQGTNDHSGQVCPHLDLNWPGTGGLVSETALGAGQTMAQLQTAMTNQYYRLLQKNSDMVSIHTKTLYEGASAQYSRHHLFLDIKLRPHADLQTYPIQFQETDPHEKEMNQ